MVHSQEAYNMNIGKVLEDTIDDRGQTDNTEWYKKRQQEILAILAALRNINGSKYWKTLDELLWKDIVRSLENTLRNTSDEKQIYRLQGQLVWARSFSDFSKLIARFENELRGISSQLTEHGTTQEN